MTSVTFAWIREWIQSHFGMIWSSQRENTLFWHWLWLECSKPNHAYVYDILKRTRARYHYPIRCAKRKGYEIRKGKLASHKCGSSDMWQELKKIVNPISKTTFHPLLFRRAVAQK